ncbi:efflux transporter periplasmic adaptor subunit [Vibrio sp. UCD-FRSSP16_10]|uniref:efflux RND transporter periplasmic adaptor subunit n=1 Tax=unclassified Vibrio TaxID=2614977 RepID=UPI0007FCA2AA|nr:MULTISPECIES: efflux RND transporter periplasmic adaptor subunit [unclassified Vibrio]OBT13707.1 efflux transporter periplasmic adaptor subunit [Vibrio sp. UCD-FRSSP16_30]OBT20032.1 efflux transporter periplasmic adaptor subunit [Vibrio sp. UCD-FRSSP16_10]
MKKSLLAVSLMSAFFLVGCGEAKKTQRGGEAPTVVVEPATVISHQPSKSYVGRIEAIEDVDITAQVTGYLKQRHFKEGQIVEKGQLLYTIEPSSFKAQVASAKASVAQASALLKRAENDYKRAKNLLPKGSISQSEYDSKQAEKLAASAQLEAANAELLLAQVNLSYTKITAPFSGRISDTKVSTGDLLSPSSGTLTTLVSLDPVHASFQLSERERLQFGFDQYEGDGESNNGEVEVSVMLENGQQHPYKGRLDFVGNRIDLTTGTLAVRSLVPNTEHTLLPGQHINLVIASAQTQPAVVIPRRAVQTDIAGDFVMLKTDGNIAERRNVELGVQTASGVIVKTGLSKDDQIIVGGLQRVRNGIAVQVASAKVDSKIKESEQ